ncbi:hypothetical protein ASD19_03165 [Microbacterium sp. Root53]|uniref:hypothetical protein n=1 Tax=Microbacterium sp. Root53 TaxID=1736553 RepID=UPI0006F4DABD|nr:hypothetical protein [Microbacterium sp. Root53]KQZ05017.1 hypothetical protein ASD19_03165 [Microbacterium sp. Root53]
MQALGTMPTPTPTVDPMLVSPGPMGFAVIVILVVLVTLLVLDMLRRVRRARYREEANEALDAEEAAAREREARRDADDG